jgi:hypothetical protein
MAKGGQARSNGDRLGGTSQPVRMHFRAANDNAAPAGQRWRTGLFRLAALVAVLAIAAHLLGEF